MLFWRCWDVGLVLKFALIAKEEMSLGLEERVGDGEISVSAACRFSLTSSLRHRHLKVP